MTDNNPLTCVFTTTKLDATGQRWLGELSNYNCSISYRSCKQNLDADGLTRIPETETSVTIFLDVLKAVCSSITVEHQPFVNSLTDTDHKDIDPEEASMIKGKEIKSTALMGKDWRKAQSEDHDISFIVDHLIEEHKPSSSEAHASERDNRMSVDWTKYHLKDGVLSL